MARRALLVGCNYPGTQSELRGCVNDVYAVKEMLLTYFGFEEDNIHLQIDTDPDYTQPTGANVKAALAQLVRESEDGDVLVFHFSGHGTQVNDSTGEEEDDTDEAICPSDMNLICDDDFRVILDPLPLGCNFTMISDCCHSGTLLDHPEVQISGEKDPEAPEGVDALDEGSFLSMFFKGADSAEDSKNRSLPPEVFCEAFNSIHGAEMTRGGMRETLLNKFGTHATRKLGAKLDRDLLDSVLNMFLGGGEGGDGGYADGGPTAEDLGATLQDAEGPAPPLDEDKGILITGCQSHETSADACPSGDPSQAFGALTNALTTSVAQAFESDPDATYTYMQLVHDVRASLLKAGFEQNPCLECSDSNASAPLFV